MNCQQDIQTMRAGEYPVNGIQEWSRTLDSCDIDVDS